VVFLLGLSLAPATAQAVLPGGRAIAVTTSISPDVHLFAEPVVVRVAVVVDAKQFDPDRITAQLSFDPYKLVGPVERSRRRVGDVVELAYTATLRCLDADCIAPPRSTALGAQEGGRPERYTLRFPPAEIVYQHPGGRVELLLQRKFPAVEVVSRINASQLKAASQYRFQNPLLANTYRASVEPPPATYRVPPRLLAAGALALAALLALFPATLAGRVVLRRWRASHRPRQLSPLERALLLVQWTSRQPDGEEDRRRALDALADVLEHSGALPLAEITRTSAWADAAPGPQRADELAAEARSVLGGGGNGRAS
jgi:hypothetical protein